MTLWLAQGLLQPQEDLGQRLGSMIVSIWSRCFWTFPCHPKTFLKVRFPADHPFRESSSYHLELIQSGLEDLDCQSFTADLELKLIKCQQVTAAALLPTSLQQPPPAYRRRAFSKPSQRNSVLSSLFRCILPGLFLY